MYPAQLQRRYDAMRRADTQAYFDKGFSVRYEGNTRYPKYRGPPQNTHFKGWYKKGPVANTSKYYK